MTAALIILILILGFYYILQPKYEEIKIGGSLDRTALQEKLLQQQNYYKDLQALITNYQKISQPDLVKLKEILPQQSDVPGLLVALQKITAEHNFFMSSMNVNEMPQPVIAVKSDPKIKKLNVTLNLTGKKSSYSDIKNFLADLEYNLRLFDVSAVYFTPYTTSFSINMFTYYYSEN